MSKETEAHNKCMGRLESTIANNRVVHKLIDSINDLGCAIPKDFFVCRPCDYEMTGGFLLPPPKEKTGRSSSSSTPKYEPKIVLCEDKNIDRMTFENTIVHELVHAYDVCRAKVDFKNCADHACTEIRASALSGECSMSIELQRGQYDIRGGHRACVKRRAEKSLAVNAYCKDSCSAAVEAAMEQCYNDQSPFDGPRGLL
jgi:mitochondrial inner membrane protease ATP23